MKLHEFKVGKIIGLQQYSKKCSVKLYTKHFSPFSLGLTSNFTYSQEWHSQGVVCDSFLNDVIICKCMLEVSSILRQRILWYGLYRGVIVVGSGVRILILDRLLAPDKGVAQKAQCQHSKLWHHFYICALDFYDSNQLLTKLFDKWMQTGRSVHFMSFLFRVNGFYRTLIWVVQSHFRCGCSNLHNALISHFPMETSLVIWKIASGDTPQWIGCQRKAVYI